MPAMEYQGSSSPFASLGRSILSIRRDQVDPAIAGANSSSSSSEQELESFQRHVSDLLSDLSSGSPEELLTLPWVRKLLDVFIICMEEFRVILFNNRPAMARAPLDRFISDFFDRAVKALDVCNAVRDGVDQLRQWRRHLDIIIAALGPTNRSPLGEGQLRRGKKSLADLTVAMLDDKGDGNSTIAHRNRSFGRNSNREHHNSSNNSRQSHFRSLSWSVSRGWSAMRQVNLIANNLSAPRGNEIAATSGLAVPVYTMNVVLLFAMWSLVAAIPCQDHGLHTHFSVPRSFAWAAPMMSMHEKILEESKKRERRNSYGLLKEIHQIEKASRHLAELVDPVLFPIQEDKEIEITNVVRELMEVCESIKEELDPLERQVREVFHKLVHSRTEGLDCLMHNTE